MTIGQELINHVGIFFEPIDPWVASAHHWPDYTSNNDLKTRDGSVIRVLEKRGKNNAESVALALQEGIIDVAGTTRTPRFFGKDNKVKRLFEDFKTAEISYLLIYSPLVIDHAVLRNAIRSLGKFRFRLLATGCCVEVWIRKMKLKIIALGIKHVNGLSRTSLYGTVKFP